jgi:Trm5-related predicted tRNA methylase
VTRAQSRDMRLTVREDVTAMPQRINHQVKALDRMFRITFLIQSAN